MHNSIGRALAVTVGATFAAVGLAQPAQAMTYTGATLTTWTYTDSATPTTPAADPDGDAPVGSTVDDAGTRHTRRAYFTFDISAYRGQVIHTATLSTRETKVAACGTAAPVQIWRTTPVTAKSTWAKAPKELELVRERTFGTVPCPGAYLGADVSTQVAAAAARREKTVTFELRLAGDAETDPFAWRSMAKMYLSMGTNHLPVISDLQLSSPDRPCGRLDKHPSAGGITYFRATTTDADTSSYPETTFEIWPVGGPEQRKQIGTTGGVTPVVSTDLNAYTDGTVLAWSAQPKDDDDTGAWGRTCYLTVDNTAPAAAPAIIARKYVEATYPGSGGPGVAGTFILDALGDRDVVGFDYYETQGSLTTRVAANHPGGRARVSVTPRYWGSDDLRARSVDAAGNRGPWQTYAFYVRDTAPRIAVDVQGVGIPSTIRLSSAAAETTSFGYTVDGGPETKVPVVDGKGTGQVVFASRGYKNVVSRSYAGTKMIGSDTQQVYVDDAPAVTSEEFLLGAEPILGTTGTFSFRPRTTGVVAYLYDFGDGVQKRVEAAADGTATLEWTADKPGFLVFTAVSVTADGTRSLPTSEYIRVTDTHPEIWSDAGSCCPNRDGVGRPVRVSLASDLPGATGFVYSFDGGPEKKIDGAWVSVDVVPEHAGDNSFTARAILADGTLSPPTTITIKITNAPLVTNKGPYGEYAVIGREATFTLHPATVNVVSYRYYWGYFPDTIQTVDAAADGSATLPWIPGPATGEVINVVAVARDGSESEERQLYLEVYDPAVDYVGSWDHYSPSGGLGVPGRLGFLGVAGGMHDATAKYLWHVNDEPVQEIAPDDVLVTYVPYTPDRIGENTLYVQRQFTDGVLSPIKEYKFLVGTRPYVQSAEYPASGWGGGAGVTGTFQVSGGMPGVVSFDYRFTDYNGAEEAAGSVRTDGSGVAAVTFTPTTSFSSHTLTVVGHTADGTATEESTYSFGVS